MTFVLGSEREGLPASLVTTCHLVGTIPLPGDAESLNVAAAGAIALYELSRVSRASARRR
jgi:tRNA G18 (ribose-2'-O)-methylase SpoU